MIREKEEISSFIAGMIGLYAKELGITENELLKSIQEDIE